MGPCAGGHTDHGMSERLRQRATTSGLWNELTVQAATPKRNHNPDVIEIRQMEGWTFRSGPYELLRAAIIAGTTSKRSPTIP
jgi:hypothetical protein